MSTNDKTLQRHGFTLLEVIVALAIAALGVGALLEAASGGLSNVDIAAQYVAATRRAQTHLAAIGIESRLSPGERNGRDEDGFRWQIKIAPVLIGAHGEGAVPPVPTMFAVEVAVSWRRGLVTRTVTLNTLRLGVTENNG